MSDRFLGKFLGRKKFSKEELIEYNRLKNLISTSLSESNKGKFKRSLELVEEVLKEGERLEDPQIMIEAILSKAKAFIGLGKIEDSLNTLNNAKDLLATRKFLKSQIHDDLDALVYHMQSICYIRQAKLAEAMDNLNNALLLYKKNKNFKNIACTYNDIGIIYAIKDNNQEAKDFFQKSLDLFKELGMEVDPSIYNNLAVLATSIGDLEQAFKYYEKLDLRDKYLSLIIQLNHGYTAINRGDLNVAFNNFNQCLSNYEELECKWELAMTLNNLGTIYELKGDLSHSIEAYTRSLTIFEDYKNIIYQSVIQNNIGTVLDLQGNVKKAVNQYQESFNTLHEYKGLYSCQILFNLLTIGLQQEQREKASSYLKQIKEIRDSSENKVINQLYCLAEALFLKTSSRVINQAEAQKLLSRISEEKILHHELTVIAKKNYCDLLLEELKKSGNEEILNEIKTLLDQLIEIAENQRSLTLLVETYLIQSNIALLELNSSLARSLLGKAQILAQEKGVPSLELMISKHYDNLLIQLEKLEGINGETSLKDRLRISELETMVTQIIRKKTEFPEIKKEEPVLFLILNRAGMSIYSRHFVSETILADQLVAGFLTAINAFTEEAFSESGTIEGIRHEQYTILMKPIRGLLCCYIFRGPSYYSLHKLGTFARDLTVSDPIFDLLNEGNLLGKDITGEPLVDDIVQRIFLTSYELTKEETISTFKKLNTTIKLGIYLEANLFNN